ncbi:hypothetical protein NY08_208 [Rhodococcus sp. B7740]|nr:hypothetical protein NY08_208 [Rhodococcus sp. B7740]
MVVLEHAVCGGVAGDDGTEDARFHGCHCRVRSSPIDLYGVHHNCPPCNCGMPNGLDSERIGLCSELPVVCFLWLLSGTLCLCRMGSSTRRKLGAVGRSVDTIQRRKTEIWIHRRALRRVRDPRPWSVWFGNRGRANVASPWCPRSLPP